ncbi:MAG: epoxide hydrolase-like predicted phosphatase [Gammaproteobacteria bacterium]|jgi:epoxide hydrolase-like predicted phosphatase
MTVKALIFDLGNVVIDIDFKRIFQKWSYYSGVPVEQMQVAFQVDATYEQHERGEIEGIEYHQYLEQALEMKLSYEQFCEGWNDIMVAPIFETVLLLESLRGRVPLYALSNANTLHKNFWEKTYHKELSHFEQVFVSSDMGSRKPEPAIYLRALEHIDVEPENVIFFDDLAINVEAARALGMTAVQVHSPLDVENCIAAHF